MGYCRQSSLGIDGGDTSLTHSPIGNFRKNGEKYSAASTAATLTAAAHDVLATAARAATMDAAATAFHRSVTAGASAVTTSTLFVFPIACAATASISFMYTLDYLLLAGPTPRSDLFSRSWR